MKSLFSAISALPRAAKWVIVGVIVGVLYLAAVAPALDYLDSVRSKSDRIEHNLARDASLANPTSDDGKMLALVRDHFGSPSRPGDPSITPESLYRLVDRVLKEHGVEDASITERLAQLKSDQLEAVAGTSSVNKFILEVSFDSDSVTALDVLAALEQSPEISAIGRVRFDKQGVRSPSAGSDGVDTLRVTLAPEIWLVSTPETGGGQ